MWVPCQYEVSCGQVAQELAQELALEWELGQGREQELE